MHRGYLFHPIIRTPRDACSARLAEVTTVALERLFSRLENSCRRAPNEAPKPYYGYWVGALPTAPLAYVGNPFSRDCLTLRDLNQER